jgi:hypothetical protein
LLLLAREFSHLNTGEPIMNSLKTLAAATLLSAMAATPVFAQAAIQEPGMFAFYHPDLDVLNGGVPTPAAALASAPPAASMAYAARESGIAPSSARPYRYDDRASSMPAGHHVLRHKRR